MRADALLDRGNVDGYSVWKRVLKAVEEPLDKGPPKDGEAVH